MGNNTIQSGYKSVPEKKKIFGYLSIYSSDDVTDEMEGEVNIKINFPN